MTELNRGAIEAGAEALAQSMYHQPRPLIHEDEWKTLEKYTRAVIDAAWPKLMPQHEVLTLSPEEQAAADDDFHMSSCTLGALECLQCMEELKAIRRHVRAITPIVDERVHRELKEALGERLLPPVGVGELQWRVRDDNNSIAVPYSSEKEARDDLDRVRDKPQKYVLEYRQITYFGEDQPIVEAVGSWQAVETVGGAAVEQDHGSFMLTDEAQESGDG